MTTTPAAEWLHSRPKLRADVRCHLQTSANQPYYQLEDPLLSRFYRLGMREWKIASQFTGTATLTEIVRAAPTDSSADTLSQRDIVQLCRWLHQMDLLEPDERLRAAWPNAKKTKSSGPKSWLANPVFIRIPFFNPDRWIERALPWLGWTLSQSAVVAWCVLVASAAGLLLTHWDRFHRPLGQVLSADNWIHLLAAWLGLKVIHEFYHGLVCKKYGGHVTSCGVVLILFSPVAFVDVTSSWRFRSRWHRIFTAAGGIYAEFFIASVAAWIWVYADQPYLSQLCQNMVTMASVSTLLFNGNFLMKYDGYYILADLLEIQNLYSSGQQYVRHLARRYLLGVPSQSSVRYTTRGWIIKVYGLASLCWRTLFYAGILFTAAMLFHGAGVAISIVLAFAWFLGPAWRWCHYLVFGTPTEQPQRWRVAIAALVVVGAVIGSLQMPWPGQVVAHGIVDYDPLHVIRIESPGFVERVYVRPGQLVEKGQLLVSLKNDRITSDLEDVGFAIEQSLQRARMLQSAGELSHFQVEEKRRESLERQRTELAARVTQLAIEAPARGRIISYEVDQLEGQYLQTGTVLFCVGDEHHKAIHLVVPQVDADRVIQCVGQSPQVRVRGRDGMLSGTRLAKVQPQATRHMAYPALAAPHGGPIAVVPRTHTSQQESLDLIEPHFLALVALAPQQAPQLKAGQLARVRFAAQGESIGEHLWNEARRWVRRKLET